MQLTRVLCKVKFFIFSLFCWSAREWHREPPNLFGLKIVSFDAWCAHAVHLIPLFMFIYSALLSMRTRAPTRQSKTANCFKNSFSVFFAFSPRLSLGLSSRPPRKILKTLFRPLNRNAQSSTPKKSFALWKKNCRKEKNQETRNIRDAFDTRFGERLAINISTTPFQSMLLL